MDLSYSPMLELDDESIETELEEMEEAIPRYRTQPIFTEVSVSEPQISSSTTKSSTYYNPYHRRRRHRSKPYSPPPAVRTVPTPLMQVRLDEPAEGREFQDIHLLDPNELCWRCGLPGHRRNTCTGEPIRFCSRCGLIGTLSRDCKCQGGKPGLQTFQSKRMKDAGVLCRLPEFSVCPMCGQQLP